MRFASSFLLAALACTSATAQAQGLGGMLNKAKDKVAQAAGSPSTAASAVAQAGGTGGTVLDEPHPLTVANQQLYARAVMADPTPPNPSDSEHKNSYWFRKLRYEFKQPVKFTWSEALVQQFTNEDLPLWDIIENISQELASYVDPKVKTSQYLRGPLSKVKEIHLVPATRQINPNSGELGAAEGYILSYNKATGVLTAACKPRPSAIAGDSHPFTDFIAKNVQ